MGRSSRALWGFVSIFALLIISSTACLVWCQGISQSPYSAPSMVRSGLDLSPSNPLGMPGTTGGPPRGSDSIFITDAMLRDILGPIPNLQFGYVYSFGDIVDSDRLTIDYILPIQFGNSVVFGEAFGQFQDFWQTVFGDTKHRFDLSLGGGYRTMLNRNTMVGVNAFFDAARQGDEWFTSGGLGFEYAALIAGSDAIDLKFNWYGDFYRSDALLSVFRNGPQNYDFQAGYSHELWDTGPDLRLSATGYRFGAHEGVYGKRAGAALTTRDGMFSVKYEIGNDRFHDTYHTVSAMFNVGLDLGAVLDGKSPIVMPEPVFKSPRNLAKPLTSAVCPERFNFYLGGSPCGGIFFFYGPMFIPANTWFNQDQCPYLGACRRVRVQWSNIVPDPNRLYVWFGFGDGENAYIGGNQDKIDMSQASGTAVRNLVWAGEDTRNVFMYGKNGTSVPLVIPDGGFISILFF